VTHTKEGMTGVTHTPKSDSYDTHTQSSRGIQVGGGKGRRTWREEAPSNKAAEE
jgi:hypothetical protein